MARRQVAHGPDEETAPGRAMLTRVVQHVVDVASDLSWGLELRRTAAERGFRSIVAVPMLRGGDAVGAIGVTRERAGGFSATEIALLQTFADQAVIAIENARLFGELEQRTDDSGAPSSQLTALGEVGQAVSSSLISETVLTTIVARAVQLSGLDGGVDLRVRRRRTSEFSQRRGDRTAGAMRSRGPTQRPDPQGEGVVGRTAITLRAGRRCPTSRWPAPTSAGRARP